MNDIENLLAGQARYYRERAEEYDDWWFRRGRYDHGADANARWFADAAEVQAALERFEPVGEVLELACGTGLWTAHLASLGQHVTAVDASPEMLELNRQRVVNHEGVEDSSVTYVEADLFEWEPDRTYDVCFFSFWLSHVPEERFAAFWEKVRRALTPEGRVFLLDSSRSDLASAIDHELPDEGDHVMLRRLANGSEFQIVKRFYEPQTLERQLAELGWCAELATTNEFFVYGQTKPAE
jgi:ubiquinone/menaquinone biosynthesis C-methylase UbiE